MSEYTHVHACPHGGHTRALEQELELQVVVSCVGSPSLVTCKISKFSKLLSQSLQPDPVTFEVVIRSHSRMMLAVQAFQLLNSIHHVCWFSTYLAHM